MKNFLLFLILISFYFLGYSQSYYVTGSFQGWDPSSTVMYDDGTNGDVAANDGIYSREILIVSAGNYEWKVTIGNWTQTWPSSNSWFETTSENQSILFTFNTNQILDAWLPNQYILCTNESKPTSLVAVGTFQSELGEPGGDWVNTSTVTVLHDDGLDGDFIADDGIYTFHAVLPAGTWEGKVVKSDVWNGWGTDGRSINALNLFFATTENQHIYIYVNINTGRIMQGFDFPIPVELTSFVGSSVNGNVELNWATATESNNSGFEIQRSTDGSSFIKIGFVSGNGTTTEIQNYSYTDSKLSIGSYSYRLKQVDFDGSFEYSSVVNVDLTAPTVFALEQNYPNPFNPSTLISYSIPQNSFVTLKVYDIIGNEVATLVNQTQSAGKYDFRFDASNLSNGVYMYSIKTDNFSSTKKMILMK